LAVVGLAVLCRAEDGLAQGKKGLRFEVYKDSADEFRWRLKGSDDKVLATGGQAYKAKASCLNGVKLMQKEANGKLTFEVYEDKGKAYRWRAKSPNGQVVAASGSSFEAKGDCEKAVAAIKKGAAKAKVVEVE
jgi:uncharacterized protein YegP (UPF0339 family)